MRKIVINFVVAVIGLIAVLMLLPEAKASARLDASVEKCANTALLKGAGWSAAYGGGLLGVGAAISIATAPVSVPVAAATAIVAANVITGGLVGAGSSMVTRISDMEFFKRDPLVVSCAAQKVTNTANETLDAFKKLMPL